MSKPWEKRLRETIGFIETTPMGGGADLADRVAVWVNQLDLTKRQQLSDELSLDAVGLFSRGTTATRSLARSIGLLNEMNRVLGMKPPTRQRQLLLAPSVYADRPEPELRKAFTAAATETRQSAGRLQLIDQPVVYLPRAREFLQTAASAPALAKAPAPAPTSAQRFVQTLIRENKWNGGNSMWQQAIEGHPMALRSVSPRREIYLMTHGGEGFSTKGTRWGAVDMADQLQRDGLNQMHSGLTLLVCNAGQAAYSKGTAAEIEQMRRDYRAQMVELVRLEAAYPGFAKYPNKPSPGDKAKPQPLAEHEAKLHAMQDRFKLLDAKDDPKDAPHPDYLDPLAQRLSRALYDKGYERLRITAFKGEVLFGLGNDQLRLLRNDKDVLASNEYRVHYRGGNAV